MSAASVTYSKRSKGYLPVNSGQVMIFGVFKLGLLKKFGLSNRHRRCVGEFVSAQNAVPNEFQHLLSCLKKQHVNSLGDCDEAFARIIIRRSPYIYHLILNLPDWALFSWLEILLTELRGQQPVCILVGWLFPSNLKSFRMTFIDQS